MFQAIAVHHPKAERVDDWIAFMHRVIAATEGAPGLLEFTAWRDPGGAGPLIGLSRWESAEAFQAALPRIRSLDRDASWDAAPDVLSTSVATSPTGVSAP